MKETPTTPYLIRAIYEWCGDNGLTPYIAVKVDETTQVPREYVKKGEIVLNIGSDAAHNLKIGNDLIRFSARFSGVSREISVPIGAVAGIFAKETGHGLSFQTAPSSGESLAGNESSAPPVEEAGHQPEPPTGGKPRLQIVK